MTETVRSFTPPRCGCGSEAKVDGFIVKFCDDRTVIVTFIFLCPICGLNTREIIVKEGI